MTIKKDRIIIVGDVHGCYDELQLLLSNLKFDKTKDRLIFAGDLPDRGPKTGEVVRFVRNGGYECVCGNHDDKHIRNHKHEKLARENPKYKNPIHMSEDKRIAHSQMSDEDLEWMTALPKKIYIEEYNLLVVHAGVLPHRDPLHQQNDVYMYCRYIHEKTHKMLSLSNDFRQPKDSILWADVYDGDINIVYGHNVHDLVTPHVTENEKGYKTWGLDTGCVFGGHLSCLVVEENKQPYVAQVKAAKNYFKKN